MIRLTVPSLDAEDLKAVSDTIATGYLVQGPRVAEFEAALEKETGAPHVVVVSNGTAALHLALLALDVRPGDLVLVTAYSWLSTANVIELCGAQSVFVDIQPDSFNLDPDALDAKLRLLMANPDTARRVKAIIPIDAFGLMANLPAINRLAASYGLPVVEDAACALGAKHEGRLAGSSATLGTFSLHPRKAITTGEGGAISTHDAQLAWKMRALRNHGLDPDSPTPRFVMPGFNYRLTEFQAALGLSQLRKLPRLIARRRELAANYDRLLAGTSITPPRAGSGHEPVYQSYVCLLPPEAAAGRADLIARLKQAGIETTIGTWHMPMTEYFQTRYGYRAGDFPATDQVFARALSLPLYDTLSETDQERVVQTLIQALG